MKKTIIWIVIVLVVIIVAIIIGSSNSQPKQAVRGFNLGLISILSGDYAAVGENIRNGVILASEQYNEAHPDAKVNLSIEDDGFSGGKGVSAYQKMVAVNKIDALINVSTPTIDAIYQAVSSTDIPVVQVGEQGQEPTDDNVFGILPSSIASEYDYGVYLREKGVKEMSIVYTNIDAMVRFVDSFKKGFNGSTTDFIISADEKDLRTHALKVAVAKPSTVGLFIVPQQGAQFVKEFMKVKKNDPQLFFDANFQSGLADYQRILGDLKILDGTLVGTVKSIIADKFKQDYKARFNSDAGFLSDIGYDTFNLLVSTYSSDKKTWVSDIKDVNYNGVGGLIQLDQTGNRKPETKMMIIKNGELSDIN
jgi:branched-chain amino acid transport system substrate-binding protein